MSSLKEAKIWYNSLLEEQQKYVLLLIMDDVSETEKQLRALRDRRNQKPKDALEAIKLAHEWLDEQEKLLQKDAEIAPFIQQKLYIDGNIMGGVLEIELYPLMGG
mgnify:CR=1 FL=1